ncbi:MAG: HIRAN domain-containing protein [Flavobacteriales bacterium]|nr:HIRAN domain-containing protein [Flavobacteriales bacterium]
MDRSKFLKILGTSGGTLLLGNSAFPNVKLNYTLEEICIYDNYVRGIEYRKKDFLHLNVTANDPVQLLREKENVHDVFAIKVLIKNTFIGYIPAFENVVLANLMDKGVELKARISAIKPYSGEDYLYDPIAISIHAEMLVPISKINTGDFTQKRADDHVDGYRGV